MERIAATLVTLAGQQRRRGLVRLGRGRITVLDAAGLSGGTGDGAELRPPLPAAGHRPAQR